MTSDEIDASVDASSAAHTELLVAIGRALGWPGPYRELSSEAAPVIFLGTGTSPPTGASLTVLGGAVDGDRVAWIEQRTAPPEGDYLPTAIDVRVAWGGALRHTVPLATYNPYFGCHVSLARFYGDDFVYVYQEKHRLLLARLSTKTGRQRLVPLSSPAAVVGDVIYHRDTGWRSGWPELILGRMLPGAKPTAPLFAPFVQREKFFEQLGGDVAGNTILSHYAKTVWVAPEVEAPAPLRRRLPPGGPVAFPAPGRVIARLQARLARTSPPPPPGAVDVVIESLAWPYVHSPYAEASPGYPSRTLTSPARFAWLPVYVVCFLRGAGRAAEADAWVRWLESLAARAPKPEFDWPQAETPLAAVVTNAIAYVCWRAVAIVRAVTIGALPERTGGFEHALTGARTEGRLPGYVAVLQALHAARVPALPVEADPSGE